MEGFNFCCASISRIGWLYLNHRLIIMTSPIIASPPLKLNNIFCLEDQLYPISSPTEFIPRFTETWS
jgi:hypothetical protein